ncbi:uncharacterized protein C8Q71DRAFT_375508 [Rhodofomes roseus]|uniref:Uncharacterized protein n=1 Tax=Rhodofomes roseus TaxID=34475 RepID=A0ABQ8K1J7_9APHY|nr:uncharacterized protein C8Q71DRAFT_375508 [Rhodofomes roseus]KAH9830331.1 hypothetical protein C8Q71DRAFT_375508 [Rhodofomes roseus]
MSISLTPRTLEHAHGPDGTAPLACLRTESLCVGNQRPPSPMSGSISGNMLSNDRLGSHDAQRSTTKPTHVQQTFRNLKFVVVNCILGFAALLTTSMAVGTLWSAIVSTIGIVILVGCLPGQDVITCVDPYAGAILRAVAHTCMVGGSLLGGSLFLANIGICQSHAVLIRRGRGTLSEHEKIDSCVTRCTIPVAFLITGIFGQAVGVAVLGGNPNGGLGVVHALQVGTMGAFPITLALVVLFVMHRARELYASENLFLEQCGGSTWMFCRARPSCQRTE